jgi:CRISPR/Cas system CSM-associated protein Csm3 (group 7 of RAMP superfamily)
MGDNTMDMTANDSKKPVTHIYIARVTIEFKTPFHVGSGDEGEVSDATVVCDMNGLPTIPGSSIAGVLRASFLDRFGCDEEKKLFGFQEKDEGQGSKLSISWAYIHDCHNIPVEGLPDKKRMNDPVLANAFIPTLRDHVKINHLGASSSDEHGKFDELAVCAGHRFTFECMLQGVEEDKILWSRLMEVIQDDTLRLGGKTRRGFGAFKIITINTRTFRLESDSDFKAFSRYPSSLEITPEGFEKPAEDPSCNSNSVKREILLQPCEYWMFGGGNDQAEDGFEVDMAPVRDTMIDWSEIPGKPISDVVYLPGSSVKGALAHRVAYHYNRLTEQFSDQQSPEEFSELQNHNPAVEQIFGFAKEGKGETNEGLRGKVMIDDVFINSALKSQVVHHVSIDRFTGGARTLTGGLFSERPFWGGPDIFLTIHVMDFDKIDHKAKKALDAAIDDLCESRLALGGGTGRGLGFFKMIKDTKWTGRTEKEGVGSGD